MTIDNKAILEKAIQKTLDNLPTNDSTVISKVITDTDGRYVINSLGEVYGPRGVIKKWLDYKGYERVTLNRKVHGKWKSKQALYHRLYATAFIANPLNLPIVHHIDGNPLNNTRSNLKWVTASENVKDGFDRGRKVWNKGLRSIENMTLQDLAEQLPRLQEECRALWGEDDFEKCRQCNRHHYRENDNNDNISGFEYHLQEMVIDEDPIKYLGDNI